MLQVSDPATGEAIYISMTVPEIQRLVAAQIPLAQMLHLQLEEVSPNFARLLLPFDPLLLNHVGTLHAGALFTAAETCALALGYTLLPISEVQCHSKAVEMRFRKPARHDLWATAQLAPLADGSPNELLARLTAEGKIDAQVMVELSDQAGERAAEGTITLILRRL